MRTANATTATPPTEGLLESMRKFYNEMDRLRKTNDYLEELLRCRTVEEIAAELPPAPAGFIPPLPACSLAGCYLGLTSAPLGCRPIAMVDSVGPIQTWRQVRFPRSKKRRIRRKWAQRPENWDWVDP